MKIYDPRSVATTKEGRDLTPMTRTLKPTEMSKRQSDSTKTPPKSSITQRLWTDIGRSVGVTTATQLVWLTGNKVLQRHFYFIKAETVIYLTFICKGFVSLCT